jgi:hypothetical protein
MQLTTIEKGILLDLIKCEISSCKKEEKDTQNKEVYVEYKNTLKNLMKKIKLNDEDKKELKELYDNGL